MKKDYKEKFDLINTACAQDDSPKKIKNLFNKNFNINEKDENGRTPLMISATWGSPSVMKFLLEKGADKTIKCDEGQDIYFYVKNSSFPRDEDKEEMLSLLKINYNKSMSDKNKIPSKLLEKITKEFDTDADIIVGDEDKLIMIRTGSEHDTEYYITIEKILGEEDDGYEYVIIGEYSMTNGDTSTMNEALEAYLGHASKLNLANEYGGTIKYLEMFFSH